MLIGISQSQSTGVRFLGGSVMFNGCVNMTWYSLEIIRLLVVVCHDENSFTE